MPKLTRIALAAAGLGGLLWTVKAIVIAARNGSFDPLEGVFFIGGLLAIVAASVLVPLALAGRLRPAARAGLAVAGTIGFVALTLLLEAIGKSIAGGVYDGGNVGIAEESGILLAGLGWLVIAAVLARRAATPPAAA